MNIKNIFQRKKPLTIDHGPLTIQGIAPAPMTPEPDDAEIAAQALLELMAANHGDRLPDSAKNHEPVPVMSPNTPHDATYYKHLAARIHSAHEAERRAAMRYVAYCEQELQRPVSQLSTLNSQLMHHLNTIEREGGELKRRWQHCLADVTVRLMQTTGSDDENDNDDEGRPST